MSGFYGYSLYVLSNKYYNQLKNVATFLQMECIISSIANINMIEYLGSHNFKYFQSSKSFLQFSPISSLNFIKIPISLNRIEVQSVIVANL